MTHLPAASRQRRKLVPALLCQLNDAGLLASLDKLSTADASARNGDAPSIAAHVDHLRYGLSVLNLWAAGSLPKAQDMDWTASWRKNVVSDDEWRTLRGELRREARAWVEALRTLRDEISRSPHGTLDAPPEEWPHPTLGRLAPRWRAH